MWDYETRTLSMIDDSGIMMIPVMTLPLVQKQTRRLVRFADMERAGAIVIAVVKIHHRCSHPMLIRQVLSTLTMKTTSTKMSLHLEFLQPLLIHQFPEFMNP